MYIEKINGECVFCICMCLLVEMGVVAGDRSHMMEEDQARTRLINVSDGLWHWAAVRSFQ